MSITLSAIVAPTVFGLSWWGGRTLARHYSDGWEVLGALVTACAILGPGVIWGTTVLPLTASACAAGLLGGYDRRTRVNAPTPQSSSGSPTGAPPSPWRLDRLRGIRGTRRRPQRSHA